MPNQNEDTINQEETLDTATEATSFEPANDNPENTSDLNQILDRLYKKLPKIIARLRDDTTDPELITSLHTLFTSFKKINNLELQILPPEQKGQYKDLNIQRLYELAIQGGGGADTQELIQANASFAEENQILATTIESLSFEIEHLKGMAADEIIAEAKDHPAPLEEIKTYLDGLSKTISQIDELTTNLGLGETGQAPEKGLDERFLESLSGFDPISAELLQATPASTTSLGRYLRRCGFAYDHKDLAAVHKLVVTVLKTNRKLSELSKQLSPAKEQVEKLHDLLALIRRYAGNEERQGVQYQEALEEINRQKLLFDLHQQKTGTLDQLDKDIAVYNDNLSDVLSKIETEYATLEEITQNQEIVLKPLRETQETLAKTTAAYNDTKKKNKKLKEKSKANDAQIATLTEELAKTKQEITQLTRTHKSEMAAAQNRMREIENGLLVEKLESEIVILRNTAEKHDALLAAEIEKGIAFEERVQTWIPDREKQEKEIDKWKKRCLLDAGGLIVTAGVSGGLAGLAGYTLGGQISQIGDPMTAYFALTVGVPSAICAGIGFLGSDNGKVKGMLFGGLCGGIVFGAVSFFGLIPIASDQVKAKNQAEQHGYKKYEEFVSKGQLAPIVISTDEKGNLNPEYFAEKYKGKQVLFDFNDAAAPIMTVMEKNVLMPPSPAAPIAGPASPQPMTNSK